MRDRFRHVEHVLRFAAVFVVGIVGFFMLRWMLLPQDFGLYGFYRPGALDDITATPLVYAGRAACERCHHDTYEPPADRPKPAPDADPVENKHAVLRCEACHGPLIAHAIDEKRPVSKVGADRLCLTCHRQIPGRPKAHPQVVPGEHGDNDPCMSCHTPHFPKPKPDEG